MKENEFEPTDGTPVVNSWEMPGGQGNSNVLTKTLPGQATTIQSEAEPIAIPVAEVPVSQSVVDEATFVAPNIDFTMTMPKIEEPAPIAVNPFEVETPVANPFQMPEETVVPIAQPIITAEVVTNNVVEPVAGFTVPIPENEAPIPVFDIPKPIATSEATAPVADIPMVNPQQTMMNNIAAPVNEAPTEPNTEANVQTMTGTELNQNFGAIIDTTNVRPMETEGVNGSAIKLDTITVGEESAEAYHNSTNDNTFSGIFTAASTSNAGFITNNPTGTGEVPPEGERADLAIRSAAQYRKKQKRLIPAGYEIGILVFILLLVFVLNIDKVSLFIDDFMFKIFK